jgi:phage baseplate assembly protein W
MATLNLNVLTNVNADRNNSSVYTDLSLDLTLDRTFNNQLAKTQQILDLQSNNNVGAIYNSIANLITTSPGQKPLNPTFGISFRDLLFLPVTDDRARLIGNAINTGIQKFEPRVNINNINIIPDIENQQYTIELNISIPRFNVQQVKVIGILDKTGFIYNN